MIDTTQIVNYSLQNVEILKSPTFDQWLKNLQDGRAKAHIQMRIGRLRLGNPGNVQPIGKGLSEMRIDSGPGYRVYYLGISAVSVVLLCGGDKDSQARDIKKAKQLAAEWRS